VNKSGEIIIIEDDLDDQEILTNIFEDLPYKNNIIFFTDGHEALAHLNKTDVEPFLILSDVNMPRMNGFDLRQEVFNNKNLQSKCIPYLFFTTSSNKQTVMDAYSLSVQGFFIKPNSIEQLRETIRKIMEYWKECIAPNDKDEKETSSF
jgi:CheY-like chemotaxis protein